MKGDAASPPDPVSVARPRGGRARVPLVFAAPHSGRYAPPDFMQACRLAPHELRSSEDAFVDELFAAAPGCGAVMVRANFARAFMDANREAFELDPDMFADPLPAWVNTRSPRVAHGLGSIPRVVADGREIYRRPLSFCEAQARARDYHEPYHAALDAEIQAVKAQFGFAVLVDCHSMPSGAGERADIVLGDRFGGSCGAALTAWMERAVKALGYSAARNAPYAGGYTITRHGAPDEAVHSIQIELSRSLYMDEARIAPREPGYSKLKRAVTRLIAEMAREDWAERLREGDKKQPRLRAAE